MIVTGNVSSLGRSWPSVSERMRVTAAFMPRTITIVMAAGVVQIGRLPPISPAEGNLGNYPWPLALDVEWAFHPCSISTKETNDRGVSSHEGDRGDGPVCGNRRDEAGRAARAAGRRSPASRARITAMSLSRFMRRDSLGMSWRGLRPGSIASGVTGDLRSPATSWPEWSRPSAMERRGCRWDSGCSASRTGLATEPWRSM
jgi:hypothetical protein